MFSLLKSTNEQPYLEKQIVATPLLEKCEDDTHTLKMGTWECSRTPETSEFDCRGQNTLPWSVPYIIGKISKHKCQKWPHMSHLDICNTSYGKKKSRKSNWQFDSWPQKVRNRPDHGVYRWSVTHRWKTLKESYKFSLDPSEVRAKSYELTKSREFKLGQFRDFSLGVPGQKAIQMWVPQKVAKNTIWGKVVVSPESEPWWVLWVQSCLWLVLAPREFQKVN